MKEMRLYSVFFVIVVLSCVAVVSYAQDINAWSMQYTLPELTVFSDFPEPIEKIERILDEERNGNSRLKARIYAVNIETSLNPSISGQWDTIPAKGYVWRIGIRAKNALSLNLLIENYRMQPDMALYIYNPSATHTAGPFNHRNNANGGILPVQSIAGDILIVEWNIPSRFSFFDFQFSITNVGYGFRDMTGGGMIVRQAAGDCDLDINCREGNHWQREKRSVVLLQTKVPGGWQYCTGTLVNQAVDAEQKKPYILTAHHCISTEDQAQETTFIFGYEKSYCGGNTPPLPAGIPGSNLIATKKELDFTLLEMNENVTQAHRPYYAGWNASSNTPQIITGIHHPQGKVKKIAFENDPLRSGTFSDAATDLYCDKDAHWIVRRWDEGVTEPGSSGSPIFDADHRMVGLLSGGEAVCSNPVNDYYSKFGRQWNDYYSVVDSSECLKLWLDPDSKGSTSLWGYDPMAPYEDRCDTLGNIGFNETKILIESGEWGYLSGHNDRRWISFAEKIRNTDSVATIIGMEVPVAKVGERGSRVRFTIWRGNNFPVTPLYVKDTIVSADYDSYPMHIYFDRTLSVTDSVFFIGYSIDYRYPVDTFAVYQSAKRPYAGISTMYVRESNGTWVALDEYIPPVYSSLGVRVIGRFGKQSQSYHPQFQNLTIVFQPDNPVVFVYLEDLQFTGRVECYDTSGKRMLHNEVNRYIVNYNETTYLQVELDTSNLPPGLYLIQAFDKKKKLSGKFIKM